MKEAISTSKAKGGSALIMNAESGEILAMVSYPTFNPNNPERVIERNKVVDDFFEPGSLIKPVTVAGALKLGIFKKIVLLIQTLALLHFLVLKGVRQEVKILAE